MEQCATDSPAADDEQPDTELSVGDTFAYIDGIKVKVGSITTIKRYEEYDDRPKADQTAFRVTWTVTNSTQKPYDLDNLSTEAQGATTGGEVDTLYMEADAKAMTGRLAAGRSGTFTKEYAIAKADSDQIVFTMTRMDDEWLSDGSFLGEDPHWTGKIK
ncbi:hypothetical protein ACWEQ7_36515 [Streptomyces sp. NPDC004069]